MNDGVVRYIFQVKDREVVFDVETEPHDLESSEAFPDWARLEHRQCACCPLSTADCKYCPVATRMHGLLDAFPNDASTERVQVTVEAAARKYSNDCDLQVGINSLMGLMMATSGCPVLKELGAMASFHIPFCSTRETLHRTVGSYLTKQYFVQLEGGEPDWELTHLKELYEVLEGLNQDFSKRIKDSSCGDAVSNAVIMFFATSVVVASSLDQQLQQHQAFLTNRK
ncbi:MULTISPECIES: DUF6901 family protein [unclassified Lentimonas]|nr:MULTISPECIES: hypothetical protein [unclassified Lentimonas]CAA6677238.1 Unannotated [Lentimonas sp. CC4]CAA6686137.1 Unannotated [Lentimonas sp. CC6]CAA6695451.1 Unannotated [Lentimonas sp. CC10]CAA6696624.1 Unannotated [Lentimonas sp. CC19]CAA7071296.1 Unannotated [Lentimonas sp. CC11]